MRSASIWPATPPKPAVPFGRFRFHWQAQYSGLVRRLERDLPELLTFFDFPQPLWRKLRTTNAIERCFVEVRRRTRPMVLFTNIQSVERILYAIFYRFNQQWQNHTLRLFTQAACRRPCNTGAGNN